MKNILFIFVFSILFYDTAFAEITTIVSTREAEETTKPWGVKVENAEFYDYVEYDDQGRLVDKKNIIIGKGEGGSGQGGGSKGNGANGADSSGIGNKGTSGGGRGMSGQGGSSSGVGGGSGLGNGINTQGGSGNGVTYGGPSSSNQAGGNYQSGGGYGGSSQKLQEAANYEALQQSIAAELATAGARKNDLMESIRNKQIKESLERESIKQQNAKIRESMTQNNRNLATNRAVIVSEKTTEKPTTYEYNLDKETVEPKSHIVDQETVRQTTQPKVTEKSSITPDQFIEKETTVQKVTVEEVDMSPDKNITSAGPVTQPKVTEKPELSPDQFVEEINDKVIGQTANNVGPTVEETTIIDREVVTMEETVRTTIKDNNYPIEQENVEVREEETIDIDKEDDEGNDNNELKEGDAGEKDHDDEDASYKEEGGFNKVDGKGDAKGGTQNGVKIFEIERKGNLGVKAKPGINNIQGLIYGIVFSLMLLLGMLSYYLQLMFDIKNNKSNYIM